MDLIWTIIGIVIGEFIWQHMSDSWLHWFPPVKNVHLLLKSFFVAFFGSMMIIARWPPVIWIFAFTVQFTVLFVIYRLTDEY